jgi:hypothetical protein
MNEKGNRYHGIRASLYLAFLIGCIEYVDAYMFIRRCWEMRHRVGSDLGNA